MGWIGIRSVGIRCFGFQQFEEFSHRMPHTQFRIPNTGYPIPDTQYRIPNTAYPIPNTLCRIPFRQFCYNNLSEVSYGY